MFVWSVHGALLLPRDVSVFVFGRDVSVFGRDVMVSSFENERVF